MVLYRKYFSVKVPASFSDFLTICRTSRKLVLFVVFVALFLDNMLLTTVVPIIPNFLFELEYGHLINDCLDGFCDNSSLSSSTTGDGLSNNQYSDSNSSSTKAASRNSSQHRQIQHTDIVEENIAVGLMFASKAMVQLITNPFVGPLTNRVGYGIPMFTGFVIMFVSTVIFAFAENYTVLFLARAVQGIGSACSSVSGMGMLADRYPDDAERGHAMGIALGGLALGVLVGPPFGGVLYEFVGKETPFLLLAALALLDGTLQLTILDLKVRPEEQKGSSLKELLRDPYIILAAGSITFGNMGVAMLEPSLPLWMHERLGSPAWQQGIVFLPASISYLIGTNIFGPLAFRIGRWLSALIGMVGIGLCFVAIPFSEKFSDLLFPNAGWGFAVGMVDSAMLPVMGYLVDLRHVSVYGSVYAIADVAFCVGFAIGPALSGAFVKVVGFGWMLWIMAIVNFVYSPILVFLRNPPAKTEIQTLIMNEKPPSEQHLSFKSSKYEKFDDNDEEYE